MVYNIIIIWAFHSTEDPQQECFDTTTYHTNKGSQSINLDSGVPKEIELEDDVDTTYYCKLFEIPYYNNTQHIVKYETIVKEGNEAVVHHIIIYYCPEYIATSNHNVMEGDCNDYSINIIICLGYWW